MSISRWAGRLRAAGVAAGLSLFSLAAFAVVMPDEPFPAADLPPGFARLVLDPQPSTFRLPPPPGYLLQEKAGVEPKATVSINYLPAGAGQFGDSCIAWPEQPKAAFTFAANVWASQLRSTVPITIDACWANNMETNVLGHAGAMNHFRNFTGAPVTGVWYPSALANALRGSRLDSTTPDIYAAFNSTFSWYVGTDGNTPSTQSDFASVALHEIGHGLGFSGSMEVASGIGSWGFSGFPLPYDRFTENAAGQGLINTGIFANPSAALATQLQSGFVYFDGPNANAANGGSRVPLYAPATWSGGSSYSHLAESFNNTPNALMTYALARGESIHDPGPVALGVLRDLGWGAALAQFTLTVAKSGAGSGTVSSSPAGISCGSTCAASFPAGTAVTLSAAPASGSRFSGWSGACSGTGSCAVTLNAAATATATFVRTATLTVTRAGTGSGTVTSTPAGINCGSACSLTLDSGSAVTLSASPTAGAVFAGWSGACSGTGACTVTLSAATSVTATFNLPPPATITVAKSGSGSGTVVSTPGGISCGATCSTSFAAGTAVTLTATPAPGSAFTGWTTGTCTGTAPCSFAATANATYTASFAPLSGSLAASVALLDFGAQSMLTTSPAQAVTLSNTGSTTVTVSSLAASASFGVSHGCATLAPGASCSALVTFTPQAPGTLTGALTLTSTAGTSAIALSGIGERSLVTHYYRSILRRAPDSGGKGFWDSEAGRVASLGANVNETWFAMANSFFTSAEYLAFNRASADYVRDLYQTFFNRPADAAGLAYWTGQLDAGLPREVLLANFMFSTEFATFTRAIFGNTPARAEVDAVIDLYRGLLARLPDSAGFTHWVGQLRIAQCSGRDAVYALVESLSSSFAGSGEYAARGRTNAAYVGDLYNAFLRRGGDLAGVQFWISQLDSGARTRDRVRRDFIASPEFDARVSAIVAQGCLG